MDSTKNKMAIQCDFQGQDIAQLACEVNRNSGQQQELAEVI